MKTKWYVYGLCVICFSIGFALGRWEFQVWRQDAFIRGYVEGAIKANEHLKGFYKGLAEK